MPWRMITNDQIADFVGKKREISLSSETRDSEACLITIISQDLTHMQHAEQKAVSRHRTKYRNGEGWVASAQCLYKGMHSTTGIMNISSKIQIYTVRGLTPLCVNGMFAQDSEALKLQGFKASAYILSEDESFFMQIKQLFHIFDTVYKIANYPGTSTHYHHPSIGGCISSDTEKYQHTAIHTAQVLQTGLKAFNARDQYLPTSSPMYRHAHLNWRDAIVYQHMGRNHTLWMSQYLQLCLSRVSSPYPPAQYQKFCHEKIIQRMIMQDWTRYLLFRNPIHFVQCQCVKM